MSPRETEGFPGNPEEESGQEGAEHGAKSLDLAKAAGTVAAGLAMRETVEAQDIKRERLERDPNFLQFPFAKVDFKREVKPIDPSTGKFIESFIELQNQVLDYIGATARIGTGVRGEKVVIDPRVEDSRRRLWQLLKDFLKLGGDYTEKDLNYAMTYQLPQRMADYRILVKNYASHSTNDQAGVILNTYLISGFYKVDSMTTDKVDVWRKKIDRDIVTVSPLATKTHQTLVEKLDPRFPAQHMYQNIILDSRAEEQQLDVLRSAQVHARKFADLSSKDVLTSISKATNQRAQAGFFASHHILNRYPPETLAGQTTGKNIAHETGHIFFYEKNFGFVAAPRTESSRDLKIYQANAFVHDEIAAFLTELRSHRQRAFTLLNLLKFLQEGVQDDFAHEEGAIWVMERMVNLIRNDPKAYGVELDVKSPVNIESQIVLQLPDLLEKPELFDKLSEEAMKIHQNNLQQDFSAKYFRFQGLPVPPDLPNVPLVEPQVEEKREFPWVETGVGVGVGAGLTAAVIGLHRLQKRKQMVEVENQLLGSLRSFRGERINPNKIISDLQLGIKKSAVDPEARARALADLTRLGQKDKKIAGAADYLRRRLGAEKQDKVNEKEKKGKK